MIIISISIICSIVINSISSYYYQANIGDEQMLLNSWLVQWQQRATAIMGISSGDLSVRIREFREPGLL